MKTRDSLNGNILFVGIGGQGVLKAAEVCAWVCLIEGFKVKKSEIHGMAQRGGTVVSHVRFGEEVFSPLIPMGKADYLLGFDRVEAVKMRAYLRKNGREFSSYIRKGLERVDNAKYLNSFLLGVLSSCLSFTGESWIKSLEINLPGRYLDRNIEAFKMGRDERTGRGER